MEGCCFGGTQILFCLFGEDTGIFERTQFQEFIESTREDGSDLATHLVNLFHIFQAEEAEAHYQSVNVFAKQVNLFPADSQSRTARSANGSNGFDYILGNPPFIGKQRQNEQQKTDMALVFSGVQGAGVLDYVAAWYLKAAQYIQNTDTKVAFVSTNSIAQGEQVGVLWGLLFNFYKVKIHFAHRTFSWSNEAKGNAAVHVVIIGFGAEDIGGKRLYDYTDIKGEPQERAVKNINPYLAEGNDMVISSRTKPLCDVPKMVYGSKPVDNGQFFFTDEQKATFLKIEPLAETYIRPIISSHEFLNGKNRWCLWLVGISPTDLRRMPHVMKRLEAVRDFRAQSTKASVRAQATTPGLFSEIRQPVNNYIVIPRHSTENRAYIPFGFFDATTIVSDSCTALPQANLYLFGQLTSLMHMTWVKHTCGRIKSDFRYSNTLVYNNYPFPLNPTDAQKKKVEEAAQAVLDSRAKYPSSSLADLYDPVTMPPDLVRAHQALDKAVDLCYRPQGFGSELARIEYLFGLYEQYTAPMFGEKGRGLNKK